MRLVAGEPTEYPTGDPVVEVDHPAVRAPAGELRALFLYGVVAVYLKGSRHRQDPRGNRTGLPAMP